VVEPIRGLDPQTIAANLERVRARAGEGVEVLAATKYVPIEEMGALLKAGVSLAGENRQQELAAKRERWGEAFEWDFIGNLQSRKVKQLLPICRLIHSVASDSAIAQLVSHGGPQTEVLIEVDVAGEQGKSGIEPARLGEAIEKLAPVRVSGLMTMPPFSSDPEASRPSSPASTGCGVSRWAPPRTGRSRSTRARRSSAWARRCWCESAPNRA
jgi:PLP dependent protein